MCSVSAPPGPSCQMQQQAATSTSSSSCGRQKNVPKDRISRSPGDNNVPKGTDVMRQFCAPRGDRRAVEKVTPAQHPALHKPPGDIWVLEAHLYGDFQRNPEPDQVAQEGRGFPSIPPCWPPCTTAGHGRSDSPSAPGPRRTGPRWWPLWTLQLDTEAGPSRCVAPLC